MKFLLMLTDIAGEWDRLPPAEQARILEGHAVLERELRGQKKLVGSHRLRPPDEAKTVRLPPGGGRTVTDGPFAETREVMGGSTSSTAPRWRKRSSGRRASRWPTAPSRSGRSGAERTPTSRASRGRP